MPSLAVTAERGEAEIGENCSPDRGELKPESERLVGDVGLEVYVGPAGRREGPGGWLESDFCCASVLLSGCVKLDLLFATWSFCSLLPARVEVLVSVSSFERLPSAYVNTP